MNFCGTEPYESERQKSINAYLRAIKVINALKKDGKLDEICKVKGIQIPLYKNMIAIVWGNCEIDLGYSVKQIKKISLKRVIRNIENY